MRAIAAGLHSLVWLACATAAAQDANIAQPVEALERLFQAEPLVITEAEISRPKATGDITLKAEVSFGGAMPLRVKLRHAEPGAESFNNVPRYDIAAYELQKLFLDPAEYVVPPTALRMVARKDFAPYNSRVGPTFTGADQVLCVVQYWLNDSKVIEDVLSRPRFAEDALYARHIGQLNLLTYLIEHGDSNAGNFLIGRAESGARVFSVDNGVAFGSAGSDRGELWKPLRVDRLPADAVERLRKVTPQLLQQRLGVLAQWKLQDGRYISVQPGANLAPARGVRVKDGQVQMGLTEVEIRRVQRLLERLLERVDSGKIALAPAVVPAPGH